MHKLAGPIVFLAGMWSAYLGSYNGARHLDGVVQRVFFFTCASVLVVTGWKHSNLRSLPLGPRVVVLLLALGATGLAAMTVAYFGLFSAAVMLAIAALGHGFSTRAPLSLISSVILAGFAGYVLLREMTKGYWDGGKVVMALLAMVLCGAAAYLSRGFSQSQSSVITAGKG